MQIYGELAEGLTCRVRPLQAKNLLRPDCAVLNVLGRYEATGWELLLTYAGLNSMVC